jgi:alkanesulfonate monooxygenase
MVLRFHWSMSSAGARLKGAKARAAISGVPDIQAHIDFCRLAEECGIDSLLTAVGFHRPDPIALAAALGMMTSKIKFMVACRSGIFSPTAFVQQVNTVSALTQGRICLNFVAGHTPDELKSYGDFLAHDERYARSDEFLSVCRAFWAGSGEVDFEGKYYKVKGGKINVSFVSEERTAPEIYVGGNSDSAEELAMKHADCLWRLPDTPDRLRPRILPVLESGKEVGLLVSILARPTRKEAVQAAYEMISAMGSEPLEVHKQFRGKSDSVAFTSTYRLAEQSSSDWLTDCLWTGAVPYLGAPAIALVGSSEDIAAAIMEYKEAGISQFLFMGWPDTDQMVHFSKHILPIIRNEETRLDKAS